MKAGLDSGKLKKGTFKVNRDYWSEAQVSIRGGDPVFLPDVLHMNRAIDGDIVVVEVLPRSAWKAPSKRVAPSMEEESLVNTTGDEHGRGTDVASLEADTLGVTSGARPTAKVVGIFKRNWRPYCGSLEVTDKKKGSVLFLSVNKRIPKIKIQTSQADALMDKRIMVQIDAWPAESKFPIGHYTKTLGDIGDKDTETQVLLIEHDIPTAPWSKNVLACLPKDEHNIIQSDCIGRSDFRHLEIYSIDPPGWFAHTPKRSLARLEHSALPTIIYIAAFCNRRSRCFVLLFFLAFPSCLFPARISMTRFTAALFLTATSSWACTSPT
jgi:exosome complex exonuclease DIS3/RRP44